ncbi:MAG TPA: SURF1 family cytochrome oxidase biogenesis protein [Alphaproteobacteria bacterium]|nr:SURF1 family cytochrome oxidase biogenesis protein [Alphaproteobacteria bacterium]
MAVNRLVLLTGVFAVEAALLALAHWQYNRYHQRLNEQAARSTAPQTHFIGTIQKYAWLTNQPQPNGDENDRPGRRLIALMQTDTGPQIADLGWQPNPAVPTAAPDFSTFPTGPLPVTGITLPLPARRGWLQGPLTTTHPQLLAFLAPQALTSATVPATYTAATLSVVPGVSPQPPALKNPGMNFSYMMQWLGMALLFPILCANLFLKTTRRQK